MARTDAIRRPIGGLWTILALTIGFGITIPLAGLYFVLDIVWTAIFDSSFPVGESIADFHSGMYVWAAGNWRWVTTGEGRFDLIPGYEPDEIGIMRDD